MHNPSYFFHIGIDLARPSPKLDEIAKANKAFIERRTRPKKGQVEYQSNQHKGQADTASAVKSPYSALALGQLEKPPTHDLTKDQTKEDDLTQTRDWRWGTISMQSIDMNWDDRPPQGTKSSKSGHGRSNSSSSASRTTKGRFEPLDSGEEGLGWGVVRLYRDADETPGLYDDVATTKGPKQWKGEQVGNNSQAEPGRSFKDEDCTTLCILAVPSYLTPSDFLGFVGERTWEDVSHFRMIRTERSNRYMVLMKFRNGKRAREWRKEWNGKPFNDMEAEYCHVVFVKSVEFRVLESEDSKDSFPDMSNDPFTPSKAKPDGSAAKTQQASGSSANFGSKPLAPPTRSLIELPTCPVCLERMDESTGLLTILCQHVFHCSCLMKWRGGGCPVCRFTQDGATKKGTGFDIDANLNECNVCRSDANLWICLICGHTGCGRYDAAHAHMHYQQTAHSFAMDLSNQRVWDYALDGYVHRIMQDKTDGKLLELPSATGDYDNNYTDPNLVPQEKLDSISQEYTHLLTSQLDSQRLYFEQKLERAADKASQASASATDAMEAATKALLDLSTLQLSHSTLSTTIPELERDRDRATQKASRFEEMARKLEKQWREESAMSKSLMERITFLDERMKGLEEEVQKLKSENAELREENRDLGFFISGREKLAELEGEMGEEVVEGKVSLPEEKKGRKRRGKGKAKEKVVEDKGKEKGEGSGSGNGKEEKEGDP